MVGRAGERGIFWISWFDSLSKDFVYSVKALVKPAQFSHSHKTLRFIMAEENDPPKPPTPMKKTSAVPLKKETVRVTLKAEPPAAAPAPRPPAPTIPLKTAPSAPTPPP
ncbi:MAG: hypothetical protein ACI8UZ_003279, partial [Akkermansiaceae bacterium]